jgi:hypothetical protein
MVPRLIRSLPFHDFGDGILGQPQFAADQAIAAPRSDECESFGGETVGFRSLPRLAA